MKMTDDNADVRKDGWFPHRAFWDEVVVGTVLAAKNNIRQRWEVVDTAHGTGQIPWGYTLYLRVREQTSGEERTIQPRFKKGVVYILTEDPRDTETGKPVAPTDAEAVELLIRELGATHLAERDNVTGEITCPDYIYKSHEEFSPGHLVRGLIEHLRFAHGLSVDDDMEQVPAMELHNQAHDPRWPNVGKGGFPHKHYPEHLEMF